MKTISVTHPEDDILFNDVMNIITSLEHELSDQKSANKVLVQMKATKLLEFGESRVVELKVTLRKFRKLLRG